eukprot:SAG11_NODE_648_length_7939_cov_84.614129_9_plen_36_part_00
MAFGGGGFDAGLSSYVATVGASCFASVLLLTPLAS